MAIVDGNAIAGKPIPVQNNRVVVPQLFAESGGKSGTYVISFSAQNSQDIEQLKLTFFYSDGTINYYNIKL